MKKRTKANNPRKVAKKYKADLGILIDHRKTQNEKFEETKERATSKQDSMNVDSIKF